MIGHLTRRQFLVRLILGPFLQATMSGASAYSIAHGGLLAIFATVWLLNVLWWMNMQINHLSNSQKLGWWVNAVYSTSTALGVTVGVIVIRRWI